MEKAKQEQKQKIIQAEGEAQAAKMVSWTTGSRQSWFWTGSELSLRKSKDQIEEVILELFSFHPLFMI